MATAIVLAALLCALFTWYGQFMSGDIHLSQETVDQLDMQLIAQNYAQLKNDQNFVDAISFESLAFGYEPTTPCTSIARSKDDRLVSLRIYKTSRVLYPSDAEFTYAGNYNRFGITSGAPSDAWFDCTTNFVLESNRVSIGVYALKEGNPVAQLEDDLKMIMDAVRPRV